MHTCIVVPAFAGPSRPVERERQRRARDGGRRDDEERERDGGGGDGRSGGGVGGGARGGGGGADSAAPASFPDRSVSMTRRNPPRARAEASSAPTLACCHTTRAAHWRVASISPVARPRMTRMADWFPAFPPAPTSIVRNRVMTMLSRTRSAYCWRTTLEEDCRTRRPRSHCPRDRASAKTAPEEESSRNDETASPEYDSSRDAPREVDGRDPSPVASSAPRRGGLETHPVCAARRRAASRAAPARSRPRRARGPVPAPPRRRVATTPNDRRAARRTEGERAPRRGPATSARTRARYAAGASAKVDMPGPSAARPRQWRVQPGGFAC